EYRTSTVTIEKRKEMFRQKRLLDENMDFEKNYVFLDKAGLHLHMSTRAIGWSKMGEACKIKAPKSAGITITMLGAIYHGGILESNVRKPTSETVFP
ncbi:hypothetical protein BD408DRAFT_355969, partial [Parasitella parasitica]